MTGNELAGLLTAAAGQPVSYRRFPDQLLMNNNVLRNLARLIDEGPLAGHADINVLLELHPDLLTVERWPSGQDGAPGHPRALWRPTTVPSVDASVCVGNPGEQLLTRLASPSRSFR